MIYRAEIDGLRAVAVVPVILFHAKVPGFAGGFVGVDIFFVISGYLITTLITEEIVEGRFSLARFYERRARRILPALLMVVICCIPFARAWMDAWEYRDFMRSAGAVVLFISNFYFWNEGSYFSPASEERPLLHAWSLSVEEQFYLLAPIVLLLLWRFGRRVLVWIVALFAVAGLLLAEYGSERFSGATFYLPHTRIWELQLGVLCALFRPATKDVRSNIASGLGVLMIAVSVFGFDEATPFPSFYALLPTVGTVLIILFTDGRTLVGRLLSTRLLVGIGLVSYSAYLIHQPLFAFARIRVVEDGWLWPVLIAVTFLLAYLSWRFVEKPFRTADRRLSGKLFTGLAATASVAIVGVSLANSFSEEADAPNPSLEAYLEQRFGPSLDRICGNPQPQLSRFYRKCSVETATPVRRIAVFGDSHAGSILPVFHALARTHGFDLTVEFLNGCPPLVEAVVHRGNYPAEVCRKAFANQMTTLSSHDIDTVVMVARWSLYAQRGTRYRLSDRLDSYETNEDDYRSSMRRQIKATDILLRSTGAKVIWLMQVPEQPVSARTLYRQLYFRNLTKEAADRMLSDRSAKRARHMAQLKEVRSLFLGWDASMADVMDLTDIYCDTEVCLVGDAKDGRYLDRDHLSPKGALLELSALERALRLDDGRAEN